MKKEVRERQEKFLEEGGAMLLRIGCLDASVSLGGGSDRDGMFGIGGGKVG